MKTIRLSGRERCVLRAIDFSTGTGGEELLERTRLDPIDLVDLLNGLLSAGYAESVPYAEQTTLETLRTSIFEVNPSYVFDLREALLKM